MHQYTIPQQITEMENGWIPKNSNKIWYILTEAFSWF